MFLRGVQTTNQYMFSAAVAVSFFFPQLVYILMFSMGNESRESRLESLGFSFRIGVFYLNKQNHVEWLVPYGSTIHQGSGWLQETFPVTDEGRNISTDEGDILIHDI